LQGEPKESVAAAAAADDDDGKDGPCETEDIAVSLEHAKDPVEEHAKGVDQSIAEVRFLKVNLLFFFTF
jgi:hypothetical protein